jgi:hypothetical protein
MKWRRPSSPVSKIAERVRRILVRTSDDNTDADLQDHLLDRDLARRSMTLMAERVMPKVNAVLGSR